MRFAVTLAVSSMLLTAQVFAQEGVKKISTHEALGAVSVRVAPEYPPMAKQLKLQGTVEVEASIGENGSVEHVKAVSGSPVLTKAASEAMMKWKFKPFVEDGKPVKVVATISFTFNL